MLSDNAKAQIVGVVVACFAIVLAFLVCLLCPCPLRAAADRCFERVDKSKFRKARHSSSCFERCFGNVKDDVEGGKKRRMENYESYRKAWEQKEFEAQPKPYITMTFSVTRHTDCLIVYLYQADGTPGPRLGLSHNNVALVQLMEARTGLVFADVRTGIVTSTMAPVFNETLILSLPPDTPSDRLSLCIQCIDYDRFSRERVVGETRVALPAEVDQTIQYNSVLSEPLQAEKGELLLALHYMPTAQRIRVILLKAQDVLTADRRLPSPYAHVSLLLGGVTLYRKRTRIYDETSSPVFNEPFSIDLPQENLNRATLVVSVMNCHLKKRVRPDLDTCLGYVIFSAACYGSGRVHWTEMLTKPRTPLAYWHRLS